MTNRLNPRAGACAVCRGDGKPRGTAHLYHGGQAVCADCNGTGTQPDVAAILRAIGQALVDSEDLSDLNGRDYPESVYLLRDALLSGSPAAVAEAVERSRTLK